MTTGNNGAPLFTPSNSPLSDGDNWDAEFGPTGTNDVVYAIAISGSDVYVGGIFLTAGGVNANRIAKWNGTSWSALGSGLDNEVRAIAVSGSDVYAGGGFQDAGGTNVNNIAKWNGTSWSALGSGINNGHVFSIAISGGDVYAGGSFTNAGGPSANRIAKWNGLSWSALGSGMDQSVYAVAISGSDVYAGGLFTIAGGTSANRIAKWNGASWSALSSGMNGGVLDIAVSGSDVYAGGEFTTAGGTNVKYTAKWNGTSWSALGGNDVNYIVEAVAISGMNLFAGGQFSIGGGAIANYIARWNGSSWSTLESEINTSFTITSSAGANGGISPAPSATINSGGSQTFTIAPATGYHVADVLVDGSSVGAVTSYTFTNVTANHTISATFAINIYTITSSAGPNGSISPTPSATVNHAGSQAFTITPDASYHVADVLVDGSSVGAVTSYTFTNVTANHTIAASFELTTVPTTISCPSSFTVQNIAGQCNQSVEFAVGATGVPPPTVECKIGDDVITSPHTFPVGTTTVNCTATNVAGSASCSFTVTVQDTQHPAISCPSNIVMRPTSLSGTVVNYTAPVGTDNCTATTTQTAGLASGSTFPLGVTTNTFIATDASGNTTARSFTVTVPDPHCPPGGNKVNVCHNGHTICISVNAMQTHLDHGDLLGPCSLSKSGGEVVEIPAQFGLEQNYPNPFNPSTTIRYGLPKSSFVTLTVFNMLGQQIAQLVNEQQSAGYHDVVFNADGLASGVYFYRFHSGDFTAMKKFVLLH
jgi:hypothetical protein